MKFTPSNRRSSSKMFYWIIALSLLSIYCNEQEIEVDPAHKIVIEAIVDIYWANKEKKLEMQYAPAVQMAFKPEWNMAKARISEGRAKWIIYSDEPVRMINGPGIFNIVNPGDSITVNYNSNEPVYSGKGSEKTRIWAQITKAEQLFDKPAKERSVVASLQYYLEWDQYLMAKLQMQQKILDSGKNQLSSAEYDYLREEIVSAALGDRLNAFQELKIAFNRKKTVGMTRSDLCAVWDSTNYREESIWLRSLSKFTGYIYILSFFNELEVHRKFRFDFTNDSLRSSLNQTQLYYSSAKQNFKNELRDRLMAYIIVQRVFYKLKPQDPAFQYFLKDYYKQAGYPDYKKWIKALEEEMTKKAS